MHTTLQHTCLSIRLAGVAAVVASLSAPLVAQAQSGSNAQQLYREALAACKNGESTQSRADCMYEARSVLRDAREGRAWTRDGAMGNDGTQLDRDMPSDMRRDRNTRSNQRRNPSTGNTPDMPQNNSGSTTPPR